jgi:GNAT superfamily N-acetyltransferase
MSEIVVQRLTPELLDDWLEFFDREAFADNPDWAGCYCYWFHADDDEKDWELRTPQENRAASIALIGEGRLRGYLAYVDGHPVGWCNAAPRLSIRNIANDEALAVDDAYEVGSIVCFVVAPAFRKQGVAATLLEAACAGFRDAGLRTAEAYPRRAATGDTHNYHGPLALYLNAGFKPYRELDDLTMVRRELAVASEEQRATLGVLRVLLRTIGSANDAEDHGYNDDAIRMRENSCAAIRSLAADHAFLTDLLPKLQWELDSEHILGVGWAELYEAVDANLGE